MKWLWIWLICFAGLGQSQERPTIVNGKMVEHPVVISLAGTQAELSKSPKPVWVAYSVPLVAGEHHICCFNHEFSGNPQCCGGCRLEGKGEGFFVGDQIHQCRSLLADEFFVLARLADGKVQKVRSASADCGLDLGGLNLIWLGPAKPAESIEWLSKFVEGESDGRRLADEAMSAIALTNDAAADAALEKFVGPRQPKELREQAAVWLGSARGRRGFEILRDTVRNDPDSNFREEALVGFSESPLPEAQQELIRIAHQDTAGEVRGQALFWLAQKAGQKVAGTINDAIENDPDTEVKKKAVFAVSQMEDGEAVPLLIQLARNNRNPMVRKEALFWLGQSEDPRALDYIESILK